MRLGIDAGADTHAAALELGIRGVPISAEYLTTQGVDAVLKPFQEKGLQVCQIGAFGFNILSEDRNAQERQAEMLRAVIPLAKDTGCPYIVICGGNHDASGFGHWDKRNEDPQALKRLADGLAPFVELAEKHSAKLSIEPYLKTVINSPERFTALWHLLGKPKALVVNVDVTSLYDYRDYVSPGARCRAVCEGFAGHYGLGHVKDIGLNPGFHMKMGLAPLGTSPTDWSDVLGMMAPHLPADSWLILEHVSNIAEARASVAHLRVAATKAKVKLS